MVWVSWTFFTYGLLGSPNLKPKFKVASNKLFWRLKSSTNLNPGSDFESESSFLAYDQINQACTQHDKFFYEILGLSQLF